MLANAVECIVYQPIMTPRVKHDSVTHYFPGHSLYANQMIRNGVRYTTEKCMVQSSTVPHIRRVRTTS